MSGGGTSRASRQRSSDRGYVLATTALVMIPLLIVAAFSVDLGGFYTRAERLKRTAEAAALAGVVWMPDLTTATTVALDTAAKNGVVPSATITIDVDPVAGNPNQLKVTITDDAVDQFLSKLIVPDVAITRDATAEYEQPLPMGSPTNYFGTGTLTMGSGPPENLWAAISGTCSASESGDRRTAQFDNAYNGDPVDKFDCDTSSGAIPNPDYRSTGYLYAIVVPSSAPASIDVEIYDAAYVEGVGLDGTNVPNSVMDTVYTIREAAGSPYDPLSHAPITQTTVASADTTWMATWRSVGTISNPCAGCTYYLQVSSPPIADSFGANYYGVRAAPNGAFSDCTTIIGSVAPPFASDCIRVHPYEEMSLGADYGGATAEFYLADVGPLYAGKRITIDLWDVGEGATKVEILDPNGQPATFDWHTDCNPPAPLLGGCSDNNVTAIFPDVVGDQPYARVDRKTTFNDRSVELRTTLPSNYAATFGSKTWWKVRYTTGATPSDRTTWSVKVDGSPVRLVR